MNEKLNWQGTLVAIQPRIRLTRSFDQRNHSYLGFALRIEGIIGEEEREFLVGIGQAAQAKHRFQVGAVLAGRAEPVADERMESAEFYKASGLKVIERTSEDDSSPPPWLGVPPDLPVYRERGHRRLDAKTYQARCLNCIWCSATTIPSLRVASTGNVTKENGTWDSRASREWCVELVRHTIPCCGVR